MLSHVVWTVFNAVLIENAPQWINETFHYRQGKKIRFDLLEFIKSISQNHNNIHLVLVNQNELIILN